MCFKYYELKLCVKWNSHFNENRAEWKDSSQKCDNRWFHEPSLFRYWTGYSVHSTRIVWLAVQIPSNNRTNQCQRQDHKNTNTCHRDHCAKRNRPRSMVVNCDEIDEESRSTYAAWNQKCRNEHLANPQLPANSRVKRSTEIAVDWRRCSIDKDSSWKKRAASERTNIF